MYIWCCISVAWADSKNSVEYHLAWTDSGVVISGRVLYFCCANHGDSAKEERVCEECWSVT